MKKARLILTLYFCTLTFPLASAQPPDAHQKAKEILDASGLTGGLVVQVGCDDGKLTAALHADEHYLVQGLDTDAQAVQTAREYIRKLGVYGLVSVERFDGRHLPYVDNMVNLVVAEDLGKVWMAEAMRVLAPGGILYTKQDGRWEKLVKPRPSDIDEWTHYLHDASGNAVAHDKEVGPPRHIQWVAGPRYTRSHEHIPGIYALVSTGERIFYIEDEGSIESIRQTPRWRLEARDAFNGIRLWKRTIDTWFPHIVNWGQTPPQLERRLVAVGDRVYVTLGLYAPLTALDAATGRTLKVYPNTEGAEEIILYKGTLFVVVRSVTKAKLAESQKWAQLVKVKDSPVYKRETAEPFVKQLRAVEAEGSKTIVALDAQTGQLRWKKAGAAVSGLRTDSLCANADRVFYQNGKDVIALDSATGRQLWSTPAEPLHVAYDGSVFCADGRTVTALSADTGQTQWTQPTLLTQIRDVFVAGGSLWLGGFKPFPAKRGPSWGPYFATERNLVTGKVLMRVEPPNPGHHHRCYLNKATDRYILGGRRGTEFINLTTGTVLWNTWARGVCRYGVMPCNGLLYTPPHACGCYVGVKLTGFHALAPERDPNSTANTLDDSRLDRGPAYGQIVNSQSSIANHADWPTYRHDAQRSGFTQASVPAVLNRKWRTQLDGKLSAPTVADGKVFVASVEQQRVSAIDADSGKVAWDFTGGARIDSAPTVYKGWVLFGCRDGCVYSLRASDGQLAWRLQAAREPRSVVANGQLESASPALGSVLLADGVAYATAGRSSYMDGGIDLYRLEPQTGKTLSKTTIYSPDPKTGQQPGPLAQAVMPGARADILTGDGSFIYLRDTVFDKHGIQQEAGNPHLLTLTDFLDDTWPHRSYWIFGTHCSVATGCSGRDKNLIYGRLLVFDESTIYGYGRTYVHWSNQLQDGPYRLFAVDRPAADASPRAKVATHWARPVKIQVRAMVLAGKILFVAGPLAGTDSAPKQSNRQALLMALSASDGTELARYPLDCPPIFDGMAAAYGRLFISMTDGSLLCMAR
jgi:outer membrane protein assembly factor BamB